VASVPVDGKPLAAPSSRKPNATKQGLAESGPEAVDLEA
jgi:hypothetical protein